MKIKPPKISEWILRKITKEQQKDSVLGDYNEDYSYIVKTNGTQSAKMWYRKEVVSSVIPFVKNKLYWGGSMILNYFKIAVRNIKKQLGFSIINVSGLAIGMICTILIMLWVNEQLSYDKFHKNAENTFVLNREFYNADGTTSLHLRRVAPPIGPIVKSKIPEVEKVARLRNFGALFSNGEKYFTENNAFFAEPEIFDILTFEALTDDIKNDFEDPFKLILTDKMASKYFGTENPVGKSILIERGGKKMNFQVTGVIKAMPENSHFQPDFLITFSTYSTLFGKKRLENWSYNNYDTYLLLGENINKTQLQNKLDQIVIEKYPQNGIAGTRLLFQNVLDIHLNGDKSQIYLMIALTVFIMLIACMNFINLSTARSVTRAKEVSIRKSIGAYRNQLVKQFLCESVIVSALSLILSILVVLLVLPEFNLLFSSNIKPEMLLNFEFLLLILGLGVLIGVVSGFYPSVYLSRFNPVKIKHKGAKTNNKFSIRTVLVVFQFSLSIFLIICVSILSNQMDYISNKKLGYDKENIALLPSSKYINEHIELVKTQLLSNENVKNVTIAHRVPSGYLSDSNGAQIYSGKGFKGVGFRIAYLRVDEDYFDTFKIKFLAGRNFSKNIKSDYDEAYILNKIAVKKLGWNSPEEAIGKKFKYGNKAGSIIGVIDDIHFESLHEPLKPFVLIFSNTGGNNVAIKIASVSIDETLSFLREKWSIYNPKHPFNYYFIEDILTDRYASDNTVVNIFSVAVILAIFVACLGLFGLASFIIEQRVKEIGIRKVLGAGSFQIIYTLSKNFGIWILVSNIFAWPIAYYFATKVLERFAYRIDPSIETFIYSGVITFILAMFTVFIQARKAVNANPVDSLRVE